MDDEAAAQNVQKTAIPEETIAEETTSLADSIVHGYFQMASSGTVNRNAELVSWVQACFPRDESTGMVSSTVICNRYANSSSINPYVVQPCIQKINEAWASITDQLQLEKKTGEMIAMAFKQAEEMKAKLGKEQADACDKWFESKQNEMRQGMFKNANNVLSAMDDATTEVLRLWVILDLEKGLCKSFESMNLNDQAAAPEDLYFRSFFLYHRILSMPRSLPASKSRYLNRIGYRISSEPKHPHLDLDTLNDACVITPKHKAPP